MIQKFNPEPKLNDNVELNLPELNPEEKEQLSKIVKLSSDTIQQNMLSMIGENDTVSLSCIQLDNNFIIMNFKETPNIKWVSEEEKDKSFKNELVWCFYYGQNNLHASSINAIMQRMLKLV